MNMQPLNIQPSYEDRNKRWAASVRARLLRPANAVKDIVPSRPLVDVYEQLEGDPADEPTPAKQMLKRKIKKGRDPMRRVTAIRRIYRRGITAGELAEKLGTTKNAIMGLYNRHPDALRSCPLVATRGKTRR